MATPRIATAVYVAALGAAILAVYLPGIHNELLFDDLRLSDGTIFGEYGSLLQFKQRMLSYGSFVWLNDLLGDGWWKQRLVNIALHMGTVACLYALLNELFSREMSPPEGTPPADWNASRVAALRVAVALFALNPVAVYAVAYLIQRSIVMATLFAVLSCWLYLRALSTGRWGWHAGALISYVLAVLAKEHAIMTAAMAVPLYIYMRRPSWKAIAVMTGAALAVVAAASAAFLTVYGGVLGKVFDPRSVALAQQLEAVRPGIGTHVYALSVLNEAALFFRYGLLWFVPNVQWMSVDVRPTFPLGYGSWPHLVGAVAYVALLVGALWGVWRAAGMARLAGLLLLFPLLWFATEFSTVWVQDPFVLYRSYLWAVAVPGLVGIALLGFKARTIYVLGLVCGLAFTALALERVFSLRDDGTAWSDAAEKVDMQAPPNAVGRSRPFLNMGAYHLDRGSLDQAARAFTTAEALGDIGGNARFNLGVTLQQQKKHSDALAAFASAESQGFRGQSLHYHRGESAFALGQYALAHASFAAALQEVSADSNADQQMRALLRQKYADTAIAVGQYDTAIGEFQALLAANPTSQRLQLGLGMAYVGKGDMTPAIAIFEKILASSPTAAPAYYGRGVALFRAGKTADGLKDLDEAIRLDPRNPQYQQVRGQLASSATANVTPPKR